MLVQIKGLFTPQAVATHLKALPDLKTTIMDLLFPLRPQKPFAVVGVEDIQETVGTVPLVRRGGMSLPVDGGATGFNFIEPLPLKPSKDITGQDLNNLRMIMGDRASLDAWTRDWIDKLRRTCRASTEGIAATALTGKISWPVRLDNGGFETWEVTYGTPLSVAAAKLLDAADAGIADLHNLLSDMETAIQDAGVGGDVEYLAGKTAYGAILALAENFKSTAKSKIEVRVKDGHIDVGGYIIRKMSERYRDPATSVMTPKVPDHKILAYAKDAPGQIIYCALDDLDAKLQPLPFFPKPVPLPEGNGFKIIGQSKPLPVISPKSICWADAVSTE